MKIDIITIFPEYLEPLKMSLIGKAVQRGDIAVAVHDLRAWTHDVHRTVDDSPFGGGPGMVMKPEPWGEALDALVSPALTPRRPGWWCLRRPERCSTRRWRRSWLAASGWCSRAGGTKASMTG